jgi:hypothetical protein
VGTRANLDRFEEEKISCPHTRSNPGSSACNDYVILANKCKWNEYKALCSIQIDIKMKECKYLTPVVLTPTFAQCRESQGSPSYSVYSDRRHA